MTDHKQPDQDDFGRIAAEASRLDQLTDSARDDVALDDAADRTLVTRYREFLAPSPMPAAADAEAAGRELASRLASLTPLVSVGAIDPSEAPAVGAEPDTPHHRGNSPRRFRALLALAAVIVVAVGLMAVRNDLLESPPAPGTILRGDLDTKPVLELQATAGGLALAWQRPEVGDLATVVLFDATLTEIRRVAAPADTDLWTLEENALGNARYLQIEFRREGDLIGSTRMAPLP